LERKSISFPRRLGTQASGQFEKLQTKPKTAFLAAKKRPRMTKRWHRWKNAFLCLLLEQNDEQILPRQARDEHENEMPGLTNGAKNGFLEPYQNRFHVKSS
jgi:hypothetical protein